MNSMDNKIVVFDLDETLGYFVELSIFWNAVISYNRLYIPSQLDFNDLINKFPEFIRPNINVILSYLKQKKMDDSCSKLMIYTNNKQPSEWILYLKHYFESMILFPGFVDQIISAFKINGKQIELYRTSHYKTHTDFINCSKLPSNTQICFIDDNYYPKMHTENVYYIKVKPYVYKLKLSILLERFFCSKIGKMEWITSDTNSFKEHVISCFESSKWKYIKKDMVDYENDKYDSNNILNRLKIFFYTHRRKDNESVKIYRIVTNTCKKQRYDNYNRTKKSKQI